MNRDAFMHRLAEVIRPRSAQVGATLLVKFLPLMTDMGDDLFTEASLAYCGARLPRTPNLMQLREALNAFARSTGPTAQPETATDKLRRETEERNAFLHRDWDDPAGIMRSVRACEGDLRFLRVLGLCLAKFAPQHIGLIPPHVLESLARDPEVTLPVFDQIRARGLFKRSDPYPQGDDAPPPPRAAHLTPEQIELAGGRKQHAADRTDPPPAVALDPDAAARVETVAAQDHAGFPYRDEA